MGYLTTSFCQVILVVFMFWLCMIVCWPIMKTSFIDMNKPFGLCCMYLFISLYKNVKNQKVWSQITYGHQLLPIGPLFFLKMVNKLNKIWAQKLTSEFKIPKLTPPNSTNYVCRVFSFKICIRVFLNSVSVCKLSPFIFTKKYSACF